MPIENESGPGDWTKEATVPSENERCRDYAAEMRAAAENACAVEAEQVRQWAAEIERLRYTINARRVCPKCNNDMCQPISGRPWECPWCDGEERKNLANRATAAEQRVETLETNLAAATSVIRAQGKIADELRARAEHAEADLADANAKIAGLAAALSKAAADADWLRCGSDKRALALHCRQALAGAGLEVVSARFILADDTGELIASSNWTRSGSPCTLVYRKEQP